jgi:hypothetical protein
VKVTAVSAPHCAFPSVRTVRSLLLFGYRSINSAHQVVAPFTSTCRSIFRTPHSHPHLDKSTLDTTPTAMLSAATMSGAALSTKKAFLSRNVIPVNDNDAFNDNKCTFCWGPYDDEHPGVRILPCNHIFGRDCLPQIINAPNGDHCPICRTPLFRAPHKVAIARAVLSALHRLALHIVVVLKVVLVINDKVSQMVKALRDFADALSNALPKWLRPWAEYLYHMANAWANANNIYWHADLLITHCTNIRARNPDFCLEAPKSLRMLDMGIVWLFRYWQSLTECALCRVMISILAVLSFSLVGAHGRFTNRRDRLLFAGMMALALVLHVPVTVFMVGGSYHTVHTTHNPEAMNKFMADLLSFEAELKDVMAELRWKITNKAMEIIW